ncbi:MAG: ComEC family competence protein [Haliscomenobacteraceae bacterium CHB4]|nr:ComEC family competence protein [Haliscomenobacteraceae bacterium CHB4]
MNLRASPCLRLFIPFALGLFSGGWLDTPVPGLGCALAIAAVFTCFFAFQKYRYRYRWAFGVLFSLTLFSAGYYHIVRHNELRQADHFSEKANGYNYLIGTVYDAPGKGAKLKVPVRVEAIGASPDALENATGNLLLFLDITGETKKLRYGDRLGVRASVQPAEPPKNPHAFDYRRYLHFQNIHFQAFVRPDSLVWISSGNGHTLWAAAYTCRERLLALLHRYFPSQDEYAVASALLVGYKDDLSDDLRMAYAETGSMHALAVSGTHVGMLYAGLFFLLKRLRLRGRWGRLAETGVVLAAIWGFAFITGATASVLRATVMFTTYLVGKALFRDASIWNILAASALGLLLYNPCFLFDAGFQLSYAAVAGMVFFYPRWYRISPILPVWADWAWKVLLIGFAAQLGTLPLSLYYFHQFPVYFWLAGWAVVFGGAVFMAGGAALVVLDILMPWLATWLGKALFWMLYGLNQLILGIQQLPGSVVGGIWISAWAAVLLYIFIALMGATMVQRKAKWLMSALGVLTFLGVCRAARDIDQKTRKKWIVYHISKSSLVDFFDGQNAVAFSDSLTEKQILFAAQPNRWASGIRNLQSVSFESGAEIKNPNLLIVPPFACFFDQKIVIVDDASWVQPLRAPPVAIDVLLLMKNPRVSITECNKQFPFRIAVFDVSNTRKQTERWKAECKAAGWAFHDIREQGAWVWEKD